jgi:hypothetical protein
MRVEVKKIFLKVGGGFTRSFFASWWLAFLYFISLFEPSSSYEITLGKYPCLKKEKQVKEKGARRQI